MKNTVVSACIVTFNDNYKVINTIESILKHTKGVILNLYIVDNNSTDNTVELIKENFPNLTIIRNKVNKGFGHGHNTVIPYLNSKYHAIINPDIIINNDVLANLSNYLNENNDIGMITPQVILPDGSIQITGKRHPTWKAVFSRNVPFKIFTSSLREYIMADEDLSKPINIQSASGCFILIRTSLFKELKGFDEDFFLYFEDADLTRRVNQISSTLYYPLETVYHEWERASAKSYKYKFIIIKSFFKYQKKWKNKRSIFL